MERNEAYMTSPIGMLPIDSDGLRRAVDEIARLMDVVAALSDPWVKCSERLPTAEDADCYGCVWVWHNGGSMLLEHKQVKQSGATHWMTPVARPGEAQ